MKVLREAVPKITKATIEAAWRRRAEKQRLMLGDASCPGLALVVHPTGMTWRFDYKPRGVDAGTGKRFATRSITIGNPETHSPDDARDAARTMKGQAKAGTDPAEAKRARLAAAAAKRARTIGRLVEDYENALPLRPKLRGNGTVTERHARYEIMHLKAAVLEMNASSKPVADIGTTEIRVMLNVSADRPATARHRFGALSRFFDWCQDEGHIAVNPCNLLAKARRPRSVAPRQQYLPAADLARLWHAAGKAKALQPVHRDLIRFLIAIPCRRNEAAEMDWSHVDLNTGVWIQPEKMTKNGDLHRLHLNRLALNILRNRHREANAPSAGLVFPAPRSGKVIDTFSDMKAALVAEARITGWRLHDSRRSFATVLGESGVAEPVADAVLNHRQAATRSGVLGAYQRASRWPEQKAAMERWGDILASAIEGSGQGAVLGVVAELAAHRPMPVNGRCE